MENEKMIGMETRTRSYSRMPTLSLEIPLQVMQRYPQTIFKSLKEKPCVAVVSFIENKNELKIIYTFDKKEEI